MSIHCLFEWRNMLLGHSLAVFPRGSLAEACALGRKHWKRYANAKAFSAAAVATLLVTTPAYAQWTSPFMDLSQQWQQGAIQQQQIELQRQRLLWEQAHPYYPPISATGGSQNCVTHRIGSYWYTDCY